MVKSKRHLDAATDGSSTDSNEEQCQHVKRGVDSAKLRKLLKTGGIATDCAQCSKTATATPIANTPASPATEADEALFDEIEYDNSLWLCLKCGSQLCGRARNRHAFQHFKTPRSDCHSLTMNTTSFDIWCYECDKEVSAKSYKSLLECIDVVKRIAQKPPPLQFPPNAPTIANIEGTIAATWEAMRPLIPAHSEQEAQQLSTTKALPLPPPPPPPIPGMAKRLGYSDSAGSASPASGGVSPKEQALNIDSLPRVRGLANLGNTCFFNAVLQCLAQTPFLLEVLREASEPGEEFILPGGTFKFKDDVNLDLPMIKGTLSSWGGLTAALANSLDELQSGGGVFMPGKLFEKLCMKCPQFRGGDQHDSHELLRQLLESVRSEDLKRYQRVILQTLGYKDQDISTVSEEMRQKCKIYGNQAGDRILRPDQVFRGFMVSTLTCQECYNVSSRHEYFLDMSLPVSVEKPQPPQRRRPSPDSESAPLNSMYGGLNTGPTKSQLKKDKERDRKAKRAAKKSRQKLLLDGSTIGAEGGEGSTATATNKATQDETSALSSSGSESESEHSDADVEDNLIDDNTMSGKSGGVRHATCAPPPPLYDPNGNSQVPTTPPGGAQEKRGDSPEHAHKDSIDEDENDSGIATSPANAPSSSDTNGACSGGAEPTDASLPSTDSVVAMVGISDEGATSVFKTSVVKKKAEEEEAAALPPPPPPLVNGEASPDDVVTQVGQIQLSEEQELARKKAKRVRTQSHSDWSTTIAPRYQCEEGECSVQSCLNNFTAVELMTGNNKVGCDNCTKRINGDDPKAKTVNTNATKQFLISSPPAVLILHLKRFQIGPRCMFRKLARPVSFPMILDVAPFCGSKVKNLPNIDRKQKKLLYSLYGIVEHSGSMYGGHYVAFVKVRPKLDVNDNRWKFIPQGSKAELDQDDEQRKKLEELLVKEKARELRLKAATDSDDFSNGSLTTDASNCTTSSSETEDGVAGDSVGGGGGGTAEPTLAGAVGGDEEAKNVQVPMGKWYHVSDSRVQEVSEETVLRAQAYLLFYERIY